MSLQKWLHMHFCNIQDHAIGMKSNNDQSKGNRFFFSSGWLTNLSFPEQKYIPCSYLSSLTSKGKHRQNFQSLFKREIELEQQS